MRALFWLSTLGSLLLTLSPTAAHAEMLLLEVAWRNPEPVALPAAYGMRVQGDTSKHLIWHASWGEIVTALPYQSWADEEKVREINLLMIAGKDPSAPGSYPWFRFSTYEQETDVQQRPEFPNVGCGTCYFSRLVLGRGDISGDAEFWTQRVADEGWESTLHVPLLGEQGLEGYWLTNIERLVTAEAQTIRFHGHVIPEPSSWLLLLIGAVHVSKRSRRRAQSLRP